MTDPTALPDFGPGPQQDQSLRDIVLDIFQTDGIPAQVDEDGDVSYQIDEQTLFVRCNEGELPVMRVLGQWQIGEDLPTDELTRRRSASEVTLRLNMAKVGIENGLVISICDNVVLPEADVRGLLQLSTQLVLTGVQLWHQVMMGEKPFDEVAAAPEGE